MIKKEVLRVSILRPNHIWALDRVTAKKDRLQTISTTRIVSIRQILTYEIQANNIVVALACVEFDRKSSGIPCQIGKFSPKSHG